MEIYFFLGNSGQWNLTPLPVAEESHLLESEVSLNVFGRTGGAETVDGETDVPSESEFLEASVMEQGNETSSKHFIVDLETEIQEEAKNSSAEDCFDQESSMVGQGTIPSQV